MSKPIFIFYLATLFFFVSCTQNVQPVREEKKSTTITDSSTLSPKPSPVEDSAQTIINRADDKIKDSGKK